MTTDRRVADLVQTGKLRVAIFLPQYAKTAATGALRGIGMGFVAIEMGRTLAARLGVDFELIENPTPREAIAGLKSGASDLACLGIDAARTAELDFSPPLVQFDYTLLLPAGSAINTFADADQPGRRIAAVLNHASTFALTRKAVHAACVGTELPDAAFELLRAAEVDAFAAPREQLLDYCEMLPGSRVLDDGYGVNNAGIAIRKDQPARLAFVREFAEETKKSGLIADIIARGRLRGFRVAPAAPAVAR
jgi:polar amino acid transport system substrate-binding protein